MTKQDVFGNLKIAVKEKALKYTKQRELILETIYNSKNHLNAEQIHKKLTISNKDDKVGIATVYRNLLFLEKTGLILSISLNNNLKQYEINQHKHHDHLVCMRCGKIVEFINQNIEQEQETIAKEFKFKLLSHTMHLYGVCENCQ
ncbi:MAG: transcriptional repressor [Epsilonproteobacteria bacterium]|nr:MAG: transcriptional repressor [Campylobacterota bacterium]